jgi:3-hydroxyacyl-CoA dehydrogenase/enoyl-CoA hydratase/3-hydroxybutyryl-CoA epimerase
MDTAGLAQVVETLDRLTERHGDRFAPPALLREMASKGESFYGNAAKRKAA